MSDETDHYGKPIVVGGKVFVKDKNLEGVVKFVGTTEFAPGKWIGIHLAEPKGKNNGSVQGKVYFTCPDNYGLLVRQNQVLMLDNVPEPTPAHSFIPKPESKIPTPSKSKHTSRTSPGSLRKSPNVAGDATTSGKPQIQSTGTQLQSKPQPTLPAKEAVKEMVRLCCNFS